MGPLVLHSHDRLLLHTVESWKHLQALLRFGNPAFSEEFMEIGNNKVALSPNLDIELLPRLGTLIRATPPFPVLHQQAIPIGDQLEHRPILSDLPLLHIPRMLPNGLGTHRYASLCTRRLSQLKLLLR